MLNSIGILLIAAVILRIEVPLLLQKKHKKEMVVFLFLLFIGISLAILQGFGKPIPNPMELLTFIFKPINNTLFR